MTFGETDGPEPAECVGQWSEGVDGSFKMSISRRFDGGQAASEATDMGEFSFEVIRTLIGEIAMTGEAVSVEGSLHYEDESLGDRSVGFFTMIETDAAW